jgi:hypothetical protein
MNASPALFTTFPKIRKAEIDSDGIVHCEIETDEALGHRDIYRAYKIGAHTEFLNLDPAAPAKWVTFIRKWGPMWPRNSSEQNYWGRYPLRVLQTEQALFRAISTLATCFVKGGNLRQDLGAFVQAYEDYCAAFWKTIGRTIPSNAFFLDRIMLPAPPPHSPDISWIRHRQEDPPHFCGTPTEWVAKANVPDLKEFGRRCLARFLHPSRHAEKLFPRWKRDFETVIEFSDMKEAIHWMLWRDTNREYGNPIQICERPDCRAAFRRSSKRGRKYCTDACRGTMTMRASRARLAKISKG